MSYGTRGKISGHSELCIPGYGHFTIAGRMASNLVILGQFWSTLVRPVFGPELVQAV